ncbi:MAG: choice-of-anchor A family protein, partial [Spirosomaceae bacterium]|nr:choice-of-anchor A family protein [Spirosomataceae bacterium]
MNMENGSILHSGSWSNVGNGIFFNTPGATRTQASSSINFTTIQSELTTRSTNWSNLTANGTASYSSGTLTLTGTSTTLNVFNFGSGFNYGTISNLQINVPNGSTVLINYGGTSPNFSTTTNMTFNTFFWNGSSYVQIPNASSSRDTRQFTRRILWNFYQATTLTVQNIGFKGSIMAPNANLRGSSGHIDGQVMVSTVSQDGTNPTDLQFNWFPFNGTINCPSYPNVSASSNSPVNTGSTINLSASTSTSATSNFIEMLNNGNFSQWWTEFSTDYPTWAYGVNSNVQNVWSWGPNCTGRGGVGNLFVADGQGSPSTRVLYVTLPVVSGRTYNLSFWAFDFWGGTTAAKLQWSVNGSSVGSVLNLSSTAGCSNWQQNSVNWTATSTGNVTFAIINNETSGSSNDFAIDDVTIGYTDTNASTWSWTGPNSFASTTQNPTIANATAAMAGTYTVTHRLNGCTNTATTAVTIGAGFSCPGACEGNNLILNPQFESNLNNWTSTNGGQLSQGGGGPFGKFLELNVADLAGTFTVYQDVNFSANAPYKFTGHVAKHGVNNLVKMYLEFYNGSTYISKTADFNVTKNYDGSFQTVSFEGNTPANTTKIRIVGWTQNNALKFDNLSLIGCTPCLAATPSVSTICVGQSTVLTANNCSGSVTWSNGATGSVITVSPTTTTTYTATCTNLSNNLLSNSGFETGNLTSWDNWANASVTSVSGERYTGSFGGKINALSTSGGMAQSYSAVPNRVYTLTGWARVSSATPSSTVGMQFYNSSYTNLGVTSVEVNATSSFQQYTISATAPAGTAFVQVYGWSEVPAVLFIDDFVLIETLGTSTASTTITVNTSPTATAGSNSPVTSGGSINLTSSGGSSYTWSGPGGFNSATQNPTRTGATSTMAGIYTVVVTAANGCTASATTNVTVSGCSAPTPTTTGASRCGTGTVTLTATGCSGTYNWYATSSGGSSLGTGASFTTPSISSTTTYFVDCTASSCVSTRASAVATVNSAPITPVATVVSTGCIGSTGSINITNLPDGLSSNINGGAWTQYKESYTDLAAGTYTIGFQGTNGCTSSASFTVTNSTDNPLLSLAKTDPTCTTTGSITVTGSGGTTGLGDASYDLWLGIAGEAVSNLTSNANYPNTPSVSTTVGILEGYINSYETFGGRISGYLVPPTTGTYYLWIASDDNGELWLSSNSNPANKALVASVGGWTGSREWNKFTTQKTAALNLVAGQIYYFEALYKEGGGGDHIAIGWAKPGEGTAAPSEVITGKHIRPNVASSVTTPVYQYRINSGAFQSSNTFTGLAAGTYTITIQDAGGCTATSTIALSIAGLTAPTATGASRCGAGTVTLTASGCSGTYNWYAASTGGASLGTGASFTTPSLSTTTTYFVDCNNGTCTSTRNAATATINPVPAAPTTTDNSRCGNGTVTLTASGCSGGQISWFAAATGGSAIASNTATYTTPSLTAPTSITYFVACTLGSCTSTTRTAITANAFATPTATAGSNSPVVEGTDIYLTSSGGNSYSWVGPNSYTSQAQNPVILSAAPSMAGVYTVTVTSNGCAATATTQVIISGGSAGGGSSCLGNFTDIGGASANYNNNQDVTQTFCADIGKNQRLTFTSFALENNADFLYVYDGPSVNSPLIGAFTGTSIPSTITSSESCLTVRFTSNATNTAAGWDATLSCVDPATSCVGPSMNFSNPTLIAGTAGADGAQYRFSNILPGVDGIITIMSRTHADISIFDIDANATTYGGYEYGFQPLIDYNYVNGGGSFDPAGEKSVTFKLDFVNAGTTTTRSIPALNMTAIDVDGSGEANEIMEFIETSGHNYFERQTTSTLTITGANSGGINKAKGPITNYPSIDETAFDVMIGYYYSNVSSITFKYGADYGGSTTMGDIDINNSDEKRRNSLSFKCYNLNLQSAINISGTVWNDANGSAANTFNNIYTVGESGTNASGGIHAVLTNSSGTVIQTTPVSTDGTFLFTGVAVNQNGLQIRITTTAGTVGSAAPVSGIPSGWVNTSPLTHTSFNVTTIDVVGKDFGIQRPPTSDNKTAASQNNPGGTVRVQTPSLSGNDPEDGVMGTGQTFVIKTLPTNGILYYNNVAVVVGQVINSYNPTLLTVDPNDGALTVTFTYAARDNAGYEDLTPATVTMPFTCPSTTLTATNGSRCGTGTVTLSVSGCAGGTVSWFAALTGGSALATGLTYTTPSISATTNYFASCTIGGCSSASRTTVTATINTIPTATATGDTECVGSTISLNASGGGSYSWVGPASFSSTLQNPTRTSATAAMAGIYTVTVTSAQGCTATATASVSVASITLSSVVSACINQPLQDVATVDVTVSWTNAPAGDRIQVIINGKTEIVDVAGGATSPQVVRFIVPANGITNQNITASWVNLAGCTPVTSTFNAPAACSSDNLSCEKILYLCGPDKPADGDAFDHGFINYLISQNANAVTPAFTKPDASGFGLYDVVNNTSALSINLNDYTMVIVSPTTEANLAAGLLNALKGYAGGILMMNYTEADDLGLTNGAAFYNFQNNAYTNNTNQITIYNYDNTNPTFSNALTGGNYFGVADAYLWFGANNMSWGNNGIYFYYSPTDVLAGVPSTHGARTYLGYHMNGLYSNSQNGGAMPAPTSSYFVPTRHLTLEAKSYFDQAIKNTATGVKVTATGDSKCAGATISLSSIGTGAISYQWAGPNGFNSTSQNPSIANTTSANGGIYTVTATGVGGCTATATASVTVTTIAAPTSAGAARCGTGTVALTATGCAGGTISWFSSATGGVALTTGANYTTPSISTSTNYFVECTLSGCTSTTR